MMKYIFFIQASDMPLLRPLRPLLLSLVLLAPNPYLFAHGDFDATLAAKRKADISFAQLMQIMHQASAMILDGILSENSEMTALGAHLLAEHPAPAGGPGRAMVPEKREAFREVMPAYDKIFHAATERIVEASSQRRWPEAYAGYREVMDACVACHDAWRPFALSRQNPAQTPRP